MRFDYLKGDLIERISTQIAKEHVLSEFEKYRVKQDRVYQSDFDRVLLETEEVVDGKNE